MRVQEWDRHRHWMSKWTQQIFYLWSLATRDLTIIWGIYSHSQKPFEYVVCVCFFSVYGLFVFFLFFFLSHFDEYDPDLSLCYIHLITICFHLVHTHFFVHYFVSLTLIITKITHFYPITHGKKKNQFDFTINWWPVSWTVENVALFRKFHQWWIISMCVRANGRHHSLFFFFNLFCVFKFLFWIALFSSHKFINIYAHCHLIILCFILFERVSFHLLFTFSSFSISFSSAFNGMLFFTYSCISYYLVRVFYVFFTSSSSSFIWIRNHDLFRIERFLCVLQISHV